MSLNKIHYARKNIVPMILKEISYHAKENIFTGIKFVTNIWTALFYVSRSVCFASNYLPIIEFDHFVPMFSTKIWFHILFVSIFKFGVHCGIHCYTINKFFKFLKQCWASLLFCDQVTAGRNSIWSVSIGNLKHKFNGAYLK